MIDPITIEVIHSQLRSIADETFIALARGAFSTNIKERHDHSTGIIDATGRLIAQASRSLPIHLGSMLGLVEAIRARYPASAIAPGDIFASNDPYGGGGTHLPDVSLAAPVFHEDRLVAFVCNIAHHADMGGAAPGSMASGMTEIYQEGLRIPLVRLLRDDAVVADIFDLMLANARVVDERRGDYLAQIAACRLGLRRFKELLEQWGHENISAVFDEAISRTLMRIGKAISALPRRRVSFADVLDGDGAGAVDIPVVAAVEVIGERLQIDFTGTGTQMPGNFNVPLNATRAAACYAVKAMLDPLAPNNHGILESVDVIAPEGLLVNPRFPAAVANRSQTCQRLIDVILGCFAQLQPERAVAAANGATTTVVLSGNNNAGERYIYLEALGGGFGARVTKDGKDGVQAHITNTSNLPVESIESEYPLLVERYELIEDSGGAGRQRGGLGLRRVLRPIAHVMTFSGTGERFRHSPWGLAGGSSARCGRFALRRNDGMFEPLPEKVNGVSVGPDEALVVETPGGGGLGPPRERAAAALSEDRDSGKFSFAYLAAHYHHGR